MKPSNKLRAAAVGRIVVGTYAFSISRCEFAGLPVAVERTLCVMGAVLAEQKDTNRREPVVELSGPGMPCRVLGHPKPALSSAEYEVVAALKNAFPEPLTRKQLEAVAGSDAHRILLALRKKDTSWSSAILIPSRSGRGGYRLL